MRSAATQLFRASIGPNLAAPPSARADIALKRASYWEQHMPGPIQLRQQEKHEQKLRDIRAQVAAGKLVIRRMTAEERRRFPPRDPDPQGARAKRR
jgi:hypothetical protein